MLMDNFLHDKQIECSVGSLQSCENYVYKHDYMLAKTAHGSYDWCSLLTMHDTIVNMHMSNSKSNIPCP
jgi:hypothetical protein